MSETEGTQAEAAETPAAEPIPEPPTGLPAEPVAAADPAAETPVEDPADEAVTPEQEAAENARVTELMQQGLSAEDATAQAEYEERTRHDQANPPADSQHQ